MNNQYAIIGDIHSSTEDLEAVLAHIRKVTPHATIIGTGDLFECTVSKKKLPLPQPLPAERVYRTSKAFERLLTFPTVYGNQEERMLLVGKGSEQWERMLRAMPEVYPISPEAAIIHGHQWEWGGQPWSLQRAVPQARITFYGHSHTSQFNQMPVEWNIPYDVTVGTHLVNVGAVVGNREWVLYDSDTNRVIFKRVGE